MGAHWKIPYSPELPITLQGGRPILLEEPGAGAAARTGAHYLTSSFAVAQFASALRGRQRKLQRDAPTLRFASATRRRDGPGMEGSRLQELVARCVGGAQFRVAGPRPTATSASTWWRTRNHVTPDMGASSPAAFPLKPRVSRRLITPCTGTTSPVLDRPDCPQHQQRKRWPANAGPPNCCSIRWVSSGAATSFLYQSWVEGGPRQQFAAREGIPASTGSAARCFRPAPHADRPHPDPAFTSMALSPVQGPCNQLWPLHHCDTKIKKRPFPELLMTACHTPGTDAQHPHARASAAPGRAP